MPSLYHLHAQLSYLTKQKSSILHTGIDKQRVFYVLNPDSNLASTQETFQDWFSRYPSTQAIHASVFVRLKMLMNLIKDPREERYGIYTVIKDVSQKQVAFIL